MRLMVVICLLCLVSVARAQDYERESRWAEQTLQTLVVGEALQIRQKNGHRFLALYARAANPRGAAIIAHGRGWSPDYDLYGALRTKLADAGYSTLSIQLPVLPSTAKLDGYFSTYPDAGERFQLGAELLKSKGYRDIAIVSHSLGATMANHYLIDAPDATVKAWVSIGIINGLEQMFRIRVPVLDVYGEKDWDVTKVGAGERRAQIMKIKGSDQVMVAGAEHFFEKQQDELTRVIVVFLDRVFSRG